MKEKRKGIPARIRFEVFKRDSFTCQYCGKKAPDVVLEVDHINPVAKGGNGDIMNLVTACENCNAGKSDKELSDNSTIEKQRAQIEQLQNRREQLDMMLAWRSSLSELDDYEVDKIIEVIDSKIVGYTVNRESMKPKLAEYKKKWGLNAILSAIDVAEKYLDYDNEGKMIQSSVNNMLNKIPGICFNAVKYAKNPDALIIDSIRYHDLHDCYINIKAFYILCKQAQSVGFTAQQIKDNSQDAKNWTDWKNRIENLIDSKEITNG